MFSWFAHGKVALAASALVVGLGGAAYGIVGAGANASFTAGAAAANTIKAGTFALTPNALTKSCTTGAAAPGSGQYPGGASGTASIGNAGHAVVMSVANADPGYTYQCDFDVFDTGTLQGHLDTVTYTPPKGTPNALLQGMQVEVELVPANGAPVVILKDASGATMASASNPATFTAGGFFQPNPGEQTSNNQGNEAWTGVRIVDILSPTLGNTAEGQSDTLSFSVNGHGV